MLLARPPRRDASDRGLSVPPLGLAYLAGTLQAAGRPVTILDAYALGWSWRRFEAEIARRKPDVLGLTAMTPVSDVAYRAARLARPHAGRIVLGGPHPTAVEHGALDDCEALDHAVAGEGERAVLAYLDWVEGGETGPPPAGVIARGHALTPSETIEDLDGMAWPERRLLPNRRYRYLMATRPGFATMITSRGCPFRCSFCDKSVSGSGWRSRSPKSVVDEMEHLVRDLGVGFINFYDDNFTLHRRRVHGICEEILRRGLDVEWKCEARVDGVTEEMLQLMRRAGCRVVAFGVESGNPETLKLLRKDVTVDKVQRAFALTREAGLRSLAYIILGAPGEGSEDVRRTLDFVRAIDADYVQFSTLTAFPGTPLFEDWGGRATSGVMSPVDSDADRITVTDLPPEELAALLRQAWRGFYLRPRPMVRLARDAWASRSLVEAARMGAGMARWMASSPTAPPRPGAGSVAIAPG